LYIYNLYSGELQPGSTALRHERTRGMPMGHGEKEDEKDVDDDVMPQSRAVLMAKETLKLIATKRVLETGACAVNKVFKTVLGPLIPNRSENYIWYSIYIYIYIYISEIEHK